MSSPQELPKHYSFQDVETRWQREWRDDEYYFIPESTRPPFIIDTPPPYPTGNFHIGNALNWCYIDFIARYRRMLGYNVMFPQGWDCHGLPTEVKVEELHKITKNDVPREEFRRLCRELTLANIEKMRHTLRRLGVSIDWSNEYVTMLPRYFQKTQLSFLEMLEKGYVYRTEHPVNFCTRCETAIAFAEVAHVPRKTSLVYFDFDGVEIATSRPELLAACVAIAVNPTDERFRYLIGKKMKVPLFAHEVPVIVDKAVDPSFGTGAVMICTFGDRQDVLWWKKYGLDLRKAINRQGKMTGISGRYADMKVDHCRREILKDMEKAGILHREEPLEQRVGTCWRCKMPIEILSERQWFIAIKHDEILDAAHQIEWIPAHMLTRMENWVSQMEWDWCISRQRIFATPIPVWFCSNCGQMILPPKGDLPIDPTIAHPKEPCPSCGSTEATGEVDVLDTWMDSSISVLNVTGWNGQGKPEIFPAQLRSQGHDIIRTWAFYTILRSVALTGMRPWDQIVINGMVLGEDGFKMSKSRGNIIDTEEIIGQYGADAFRQWAAASAATGSDIMFSWNDVIAASRFQTKFWNIIRFALPHISDGRSLDPAEVIAEVDRWLLCRLSDTVKEVNDAMQQYQFDRTLKAIREFTWTVLADQYIELAKGRLYTKGAEKESAATALRIVLDTLTRMTAPFTPHFADECYSYLRGERVHRKPWVDFVFENAEARSGGDALIGLVSELRRYKHDQGMALNAPLGQINVYTKRTLDDAGDAARALNADVRWRKELPALERELREVRFNMGVIGPQLKKRAKDFMEAIRSLPVDKLVNPPASIMVNGEKISVPENAFSPQFSYLVEGKKVDLIRIGEMFVTIPQSS
ncbi:MAG: valine--tRNA ligase [Methanomicrobiales archaeon]|nr:valine--tRNA ligase [Methanomicrobiales archaeon]